MRHVHGPRGEVTVPVALVAGLVTPGPRYGLPTETTAAPRLRRPEGLGGPSRVDGTPGVTETNTKGGRHTARRRGPTGGRGPVTDGPVRRPGRPGPGAGVGAVGPGPGGPNVGAVGEGGDEGPSRFASGESAPAARVGRGLEGRGAASRRADPATRPGTHPGVARVHERRTTGVGPPDSWSRWRTRYLSRSEVASRPEMVGAEEDRPVGVQARGRSGRDRRTGRYAGT